MRKALILSGALAIAASSLPAQTSRWNNQPTVTWQDQAPRVRVWIDGSRALGYGAPVAVRFEVSENAYVTVVRVDGDGRMTILFPYSRSQRSAARGNYIHEVRNPRLGNFAFVSTDRMSGYVFALASYAPLDLSSFENRDYNNIGGYSRFTLANRSVARRPDVFIDRFAARVLWDTNTSYDYDVDYYHPFTYNAMSAYGMCSAANFGHFSRPVGYRTYLSQFSSWDRVAYPSFFMGYPFGAMGYYPYLSMCSDWYYRLQCYSRMALFGNTWACANRRTEYVNGPTGPVAGNPVDSTLVPNEGVVRGGLFAPTPVPVPVAAGPEPPPAERPVGTFDPFAGEFDGLKSIPPRATRKMKEDDARRDAADGVPARGGFDRVEASSKPEKNRTADNGAATRVQPPSREPTKVKGTSEPRETRGNSGFGSTRRPSDTRSNGPDRVSRPADTKGSSGASTGSANPPSVQGAATTGSKTKPPQD